MYKTMEGIFEDGKITLKKIPKIKKAKVIVKFLEEDNGLKAFISIPDVFMNPVKVSEIKKFSREALHER